MKLQAGRDNFNRHMVEWGYITIDYNGTQVSCSVCVLYSGFKAAQSSCHLFQVVAPA